MRLQDTVYTRQGCRGSCLLGMVQLPFYHSQFPSSLSYHVDNLFLYMLPTLILISLLVHCVVRLSIPLYKEFIDYHYVFSTLAPRIFNYFGLQILQIVLVFVSKDVLLTCLMQLF